MPMNAMQNRWIRFIVSFITAYVLLLAVLFLLVSESCKGGTLEAPLPECNGYDFGTVARDLLTHSIAPFSLLYRMSSSFLSGSTGVKGTLISSYGLLPAEALVATLIVMFLACLIVGVRESGVLSSYFVTLTTLFLWLFFAETCFAFFPS